VNRRFASSVALALGLVVLLASCASVGNYAAKVDGQNISQDALEGEMRSIASNNAYVKQIESQVQVRGSGAGTFDAAFTGQVLGRQIQYLLVDREVAKRKLKITPADTQAARAEVSQQAGGADIFNGFPKDYQDTLVQRAAKVDKLTISLAGDSSSDAAAQAYYNAHKDEFTVACVSHILLSTKDQADAVKARLDKGEDFATVARATSLDTQSVGQGGDLGCDINSDTFAVPEFTQAVLTQPVGVVGNPVQTQFGYHIILVRSRTVPPYDQVVDRAKQKVVQAAKAKLQQWVSGAVTKANIVVNPKYGTFDKQTLAVVPPAAPTTKAPSNSTPPGSGIQPLPTTTPK
jgi:parvulin-like peptidyl-prolyl isomerase